MLTEVCILKAMVFSIIIYACQSWTIKKLIPEELKLVLEKTLEIRLENKEIKPVYPKEN